MKREKILVTGGAGLIGARLCERLLKAGHDVVCVDNLITANNASLTRLKEFSGFEFLRHDVAKPYMLDVDRIYNLAAPPAGLFSRQYPVDTLNTLVNGTFNALEIARRNEAPILHTSSGCVYGHSRQHRPLAEDEFGHVNTIGIRSPLEEGNRAAESLCRAYNAQYHVNAKIARIFNTYGEGSTVDDARVVSQFVVRALRGENITIRGDGAHTRSLCYVDDTVEALVRLMHATPENYIFPVNIGSDVAISLKELASKVISITGSRSKVLHINTMGEHPPHKTPDISRARKILAWEPSTSLEAGLSATAEYYERLLHERSSVNFWMTWAEVN